MRTLDAVIAEVPLFQGLAPDAVELLAGCGSNVRFAAGEQLFQEGSPADTFFLVRHGRVALELFVPARGPVVIETIGAHEVVGWSWLFAPYRWQFDARAVSIVRATAFDATCVRDKCASDPALGYDLMGRFARVMIDRLQATRLRLLDVYGDSGPH